MWIDIACILFTCVAVNHLGLISAIEYTIGHDIPIVDCPKCLSCWCVFVYCLWLGHTGVINALAISFLMAYVATWVELLMGIIDLIYLKVYEKNFKSDDDNEDSSTDE